jgi:hypothetical protein
MQPIQTGGRPTWKRHVVNLLWRLTDIGEGFLGPSRWEGVLEGALEFMGVRPLSQAQAHVLSTMLRTELADLIAACNRHMAAVGGNFLMRFFRHRIYIDCDHVIITLQSTLGTLAHLETVLDYYTQMTREANSTSPSSTSAAPSTAGAGVPPSVERQLEKTPLTSWPVSPDNCRRVAQELTRINFHTWRMARHLQATIEGPQGANPYVVTGSYFGLHMLVRSMQHSLKDLQQHL